MSQAFLHLSNLLPLNILTSCTILEVPRHLWTALFHVKPSLPLSSLLGHQTAWEWFFRSYWRIFQRGYCRRRKREGQGTFFGRQRTFFRRTGHTCTWLGHQADFRQRKITRYALFIIYFQKRLVLFCLFDTSGSNYVERISEFSLRKYCITSCAYHFPATSIVFTSANACVCGVAVDDFRYRNCVRALPNHSTPIDPHEATPHTITQTPTSFAFSHTSFLSTFFSENDPVFFLFSLVISPHLYFLFFSFEFL